MNRNRVDRAGFSRFFRIAPALCAASLCTNSFAQTTTPSRTTTITGGKPPAKSVEQSPSTQPNIQMWAPVRLEGLGVVFEVPEGTRSTSERTGSLEKTRITPPDKSWTLEVMRLVDDPTLTPTQVAERSVFNLTRTATMPTADGSLAKVSDLGCELLLRQGGMAIPGGRDDRACERFRLKLSPDNLEDNSSIRDQVQFPNGNGNYIVFDFWTTEANQQRTLPVFDRVLRTVSFQAAQKLALRRAGGIEEGVALLSMVGDAGLEKIFAELEHHGDQWQRFSVPDPTNMLDGRREIGYRRLRARPGRRSDLDQQFGQRGRLDVDCIGYIFQMEARVLMGDEGYVDLISAFFVSQPLPGEEQIEEWSIVTTQVTQSGVRPLVSREFGTRKGFAITVIRETPNKPAEQITAMIEGRGYLSQTLVYVLPRILVAAGAQAEVAFYAYVPDLKTNKLRYDSIVPGEVADTWKITSQITEDQQPYISTYRADGSFVRTEYPDGKVWEPATKDQLLALWRRKGLPLG